MGRIAPAALAVGAGAGCFLAQPRALRPGKDIFAAPAGDGAADQREGGKGGGSPRGCLQWAILDSNQGPLPYQRSALTD
jgi:hypothetical protein